MTKKTDQERLRDAVQKDSPCRDDNERGYWRKRLKDLEKENQSSD